MQAAFCAMYILSAYCNMSVFFIVKSNVNFSKTHGLFVSTSDIFSANNRNLRPPYFTIQIMMTVWKPRCMKMISVSREERHQSRVMLKRAGETLKKGKLRLCFIFWDDMLECRKSNSYNEISVFSWYRWSMFTFWNSFWPYTVHFKRWLYFKQAGTHLPQRF